MEEAAAESSSASTLCGHSKRSGRFTREWHTASQPRNSYSSSCSLHRSSKLRFCIPSAEYDVLHCA